MKSYYVKMQKKLNTFGVDGDDGVRVIEDSDEKITVRKGKKKLKILITGNVISVKMQMRLEMSIIVCVGNIFYKGRQGRIVSVTINVF